ncbi:MAG: PDZ domain-containing protein [bacterium]
MKKLCYLSIAVVVVAALLVSPLTAKSSKGSKTAWLGVYTQTVDRNLASDNDLSVKNGAFVNGIVEDSPAEKAGLREDDIIIGFNGSKIRDSDDLIEAITDAYPGDDVTFQIIRDNDKMELKVTLGKKPARSFKKLKWHSKTPDDKDFFIYRSGTKEHPYIGVQLSDLSQQLGDFFGADKGRGALITEIIEGSPSEEAGLKAGDVIVAVDDERIFDSENVQKAILEREAGDKVKLTVLRDRKKTELTVEVGESDDLTTTLKHNIDFDFDIPDIDIDLPDLSRLRHIPKSVPALRYYIDSDDNVHLKKEIKDDLKIELKQLKKELKALSKEIQEIREKLD